MPRDSKDRPFTSQSPNPTTGTRVNLPGGKGGTMQPNKTIVPDKPKPKK
jgi:hypothetical protein